MSLEALHSKGILHGDSHWGNYVFGGNGHLHLVDFGCSLFNCSFDKGAPMDLRWSPILW